MADLFRDGYDAVKTTQDLEGYDEIIVLLPNNLNESKYVNKFPFSVRFDPPHNDCGWKHAHVKRMDNPGKEVSYNEIGTKHDVHKFCNNFPGLKGAQDLIRKKWNLPKDFLFEVVGAIGEKCLLLELND
jgi:hypothetical protein